MVPIDRNKQSYTDLSSSEASTNANNAANTAAGTATTSTESMEEDKPPVEEKGRGLGLSLANLISARFFMYLSLCLF